MISYMCLIWAAVLIDRGEGIFFLFFKENIAANIQHVPAQKGIKFESYNTDWDLN